MSACSPCVHGIPTQSSIFSEHCTVELRLRCCVLYEMKKILILSMFCPVSSLHIYTHKSIAHVIKGILQLESRREQGVGVIGRAIVDGRLKSRDPP